MAKKTEEIVIIIEPHIVKKDGDNMTLSDIGYSRIGNAVEKNTLEESSRENRSKRLLIK